MVTQRFQKCCSLFVQKIIILTLLFVLLFSDVQLMFGLDLFPDVQRAEAATGDFATYVEATGGETIDSSGTVFDVTWDTTVDSNANIALQGDSSNIDLSDGGKYLVLYNTWAYEGGAGGSNRRSFNSFLTIGGTEIPYGRGAGYIRDSESFTTAYVNGASIVDVSAGDDLQVHIQRDDGNSGAGSETVPGTNGVSVLKLPDGNDYLRANIAATSSSINGNTSFTDVAWDTADEVDTDSFGLTPTSADITLKGDDGDYFLVTANVGLFVSGGGGTRQNYEMRLTLDGVEVPGTVVTSYLRGTNDTWNGQLTYSGLIAKTDVGDQVLNVEVRRESNGGATTVIPADVSGITIMAVPDTAEVVRLVDYSGSQTTSNSLQALTFDTQEEVNAVAFSHSTTSNADRIEIDANNDYLFFATAYATTTSSDNNREPFRVDWNVTGSSQNRGSFGSFNRSNATFSSGASGGILFSNLTSSDYVAMTHLDETSNAPDDLTFSNGRVAVQGIALNDNFYGLDTLVSASGTHAVSANIPDTDVYLGGQFVVQENSTSRNVTNITVTESGTVDGANGLSNIELWYEFSSSAPYDCSEHSYDGGETQYGSTDTNGFSGADGSSSFNDVVAITPAQSLCLYVLADITSSASDGENIVISIDNPITDVVTTGGGSLGPPNSVAPTGSVSLESFNYTQIHYHWRNNDGSETGATSATGGTEDTPLAAISIGSPKRLRLEVSHEGSRTPNGGDPRDGLAQYKLQYGTKVTTCSDVSTWTDVAEVGGDWDVASSANISFGDNTTNILEATGGVSNENTTFVGTNGVLNSGDKSLSTVIDSDEYLELEYTVVPTTSATEGNTYCFRTVDGTPDTTHSYRIPLTIQSSQVDSTLTDFPVYVDLSDLGSHFFTNVASDGSDIRVTEDDGLTEVAREVVSISTGGATGELYFKAPTISNSVDTTFYIYYGGTVGEYASSSIYGAHEVWSNNYEGVYHLDESGATYYDSTRNANDGVGEDTDPTLTTGQLGGAQDVSAGRIDIGNGMNANLISAGEYLISVWLNLDTSTGDQSPVSQYTGTGDFLLWADEGDGGTGFCHYNGTYMPSDCRDLNIQNVGTWQYVVARHDGTNGYVYLDGANTGVGATASTFGVDPTINFSIGSQNGDVTTRQFNGQLDEVRIISADHGEDWIESEYTNQSSPTTFYATSTEETMTRASIDVLYDSYPEATINADVVVSAAGSQVSTLNVGSTNNYVGGAFTVEANTGSPNVTDITVTETGTVNASTSLENIRLFYDLDTSGADGFDCSSESYGGGETQFGSTATAFSATNGTTTFTDSVGISSLQSLCLYVVLDINTSASNGETIDLQITSPNTEVVVSSGSVAPGSIVGMTGSTTITGPIKTQTHYHWRNDDGDESDTPTGATSASGGVEDAAIVSVPKESPRRLRLQVSNEGPVTTAAVNYRLEYGTKITTCSAVSNWIDVGAVGGAWDMALSANITDGNTTDLSTATSGAMTNENTTFVGTGALRETSSESSGITLSSTQFTELEYSIEATTDSGYDTEYCFRVTDSGTELESYDVYPELTTREKQDFSIQRGVEQISGASVTLTAGVDYEAPSGTSTAFVRLTNSQLTGSGNNTGGGNTNTDDFTAYISDQSDITSSFTIARPAAATSNTRVYWEIIEFIGLEGTDNEMVVRDVGELSLSTSNLIATGTAVSNVFDDADVVVFITGQYNDDTGRNNANDGHFTASWGSGTDEPVFERAEGDTSVGLSYAVVEFVGENWNVERIEHVYTNAGSTEVEPITAIPSITQAFVHAQKRVGAGNNGLDEAGHQVWISSLGAVSFELYSGATTPASHVSVAWIISNTQTGDGALASHKSFGTIATGGPEPNSNSIGIGATVNTSNASIFASNSSAGSGTAYPRGFNGFTITSETTYELWQSDTGQPNNYRVEVVEWPVVDTSIRQNYYRFYTDNDLITPTDPWPVGVADLGENESITGSDDPLGEGERVRLRMSLRVNNATLPESVIAFKLQYGLRDTSCSAISVWNDIGGPGDGAIWRGYDATVADGTEVATSTPATGTLLLSVSDIAGTYEEENNTAVNPYAVDIAEDVEYDWLIEHNGAAQRSDYCFRMVQSDGTELDSYNNYPTLRTTGYTPIVGDWRWYDDENSETPSSALASENVAPIDIELDNIIKLRVISSEVENAIGTNVKFALQYSEYSDFSDGGTFLTSSTSCTANSIWCYADGAGVDNAVIQTAVLTNTDSCVAGVGDGCGMHNEVATSTSSFSHEASANTEFEFTLQHAGARVNAVYYFRLYDVVNDDPLSASSSYPSLVTEGADLVFTTTGLSSGAATEGVVTDVDTTPTTVAFGSVPFNTSYEAAYRLGIDTNATEGYQMFMYLDQPFQNSYGDTLDSVGGTNETPVSWNTGCSGLVSCLGYHVGDDSLANGSARFAADDSYAAFAVATPEEVAYSSAPTGETHDIVYRMQISEGQSAGEYISTIHFIAIPVF